MGRKGGKKEGVNGGRVEREGGVTEEKNRKEKERRVWTVRKVRRCEAEKCGK